MRGRRGLTKVDFEMIITSISNHKEYDPEFGLYKEIRSVVLEGVGERSVTFSCNDLTSGEFESLQVGKRYSVAIRYK